MSRPCETAWTDREIRTLRRLWAEGYSMSAIGRIMNRPKNSIVGKVHRLELSGRPSPIKRDPAMPRMSHVLDTVFRAVPTAAGERPHEIADRLGIYTPSSVRHALRRLVAAGRVTFDGPDMRRLYRRDA